jgi:hypothetical protein
MKLKPIRKGALMKKTRKPTTKAGQLATFNQYLKTRIETASMVSKATEIPQKNLCRYKRDLEERGLLAPVKKTKCKLTGFKAWYITTNPDYFPKNTQTDLFERGNNGN